MQKIYKYPRTYHLEGSGIQHGDEDLSVMPVRSLAGQYVVVEEKMDGANSAISFSDDNQLLLQSRGHYLSGGPREKQFDLFKAWAYRYAGELWQTLGTRYIMYGEWLYAKHTMFYTDLPHYFLEFDIFDKEQERFLSTERRKEFLFLLPFVSSVKVLYTGQIDSMEQLVSMIGPSHFIRGDLKERLQAYCQEKDFNVAQALKETDTSGLMEGLYLKVEADGYVQERYKYVRRGFLQTVFDSESHWQDRPILPNCLSAGVSLF
ncbi:DNA ligase [Ktedonosporobacter rubrisoli]|uniref:DNA ligase n=1 Tax=Ktedonosporobacter rubrisoli TaxID=2509675 RepID=A0A4P6JMG7_KTERU|nr:RNA ligase family protein [Ktedonosporobacter rubrisoli]QBD76212.1 DNA ligase [Ktedonosporobacter rubrisoli]